MPFEEEDAGQIPAESLSEPVSEHPAGIEHPSVPSSPPPIFHPLAYRGVVANWPVEWREQWGRRANSLEESGLSWRDAETQSFVEVWNQLRHQPIVDSAPAPPGPTAQRN